MPVEDAAPLRDAALLHAERNTDIDDVDPRLSVGWTALPPGTPNRPSRPLDKDQTGVD